MQLSTFLRAPAILAAGLLASCANVTFIGHERAYDLNLAVKADLTSPVATNLGFESKSGLAVPPQQASLFGDLFARNGAHKGDVIATVSRLSATRIQNNGGPDGVDYMSLIATGPAAEVATAPHGTKVLSASPNTDVTKAFDTGTPSTTPKAGQNTSGGAVSLVDAVEDLVTKP